MPQARKQKRKSRSRQQTPSLVPKPPPGPIVKQKSKRRGISTKAKAQIQELQDKLEKKETKAVHVAAGVGGAVGCTLTGALIVGKGWMDAKWASVLLTSIGVGATFAGWHYDQQSLLWSGAGWTCAGAAHTTMAMVVESRRAGEANKDGQASSKPRNAMDPTADADSDTARRLRMSEERARELEGELARARQHLTPEAELAAAA